jgi:hypothetical protein
VVRIADETFLTRRETKLNLRRPCVAEKLADAWYIGASATLNRHETCGSDNLPEAGKIEVALQKKAERSKVVEGGGEPLKFVGFADGHHMNMMLLSLGAV